MRSCPIPIPSLLRWSPSANSEGVFAEISYGLALWAHRVISNVEIGTEQYERRCGKRDWCSQIYAPDRQMSTQCTCSTNNCIKGSKIYWNKTVLETLQPIARTPFEQHNPFFRWSGLDGGALAWNLLEKMESVCIIATKENDENGQPVPL